MLVSKPIFRIKTSTLKRGRPKVKPMGFILKLALYALLVGLGWRE